MGRVRKGFLIEICVEEVKVFLKEGKIGDIMEGTNGGVVGREEIQRRAMFWMRWSLMMYAGGVFINSVKDLFKI